MSQTIARNLYTLANGNGMTVCITNYGARIVSLSVPDWQGNPTDIVHGFDSLDDYLPERHSNDFGAVIGRYANRIAQGRLTIDGRTLQLPQNNGPHCLHGGPSGWQYQTFDCLSHDDCHLRLALTSPDGDNGFPGCVQALVEYTLLEDNTLRIDYSATTDRPTVINMTNHSYFNLNGDAATTVHNHLLAIDAARYLPIDDTCVPQGPIEGVEGTPMDFRRPKAVGADIDGDHPQLRFGHGYDHNFLLDNGGNLARPCATLSSPLTGIVLELHTTAPGMQVYTGNFLDGSVVGKGGIAYPRRSAICLETQYYPDSPNHAWPESDARLLPGDTYRSSTLFHFSTI